ncbi:terminase small subunit [Acetobacterium wieringae]|uniref:Terminase small subunit n=1 Tax=Acetobacterium wieringae TaxID=52694 RepID=A0ABY6HG97_9FIRM|nr:terminase small subunit [Acetobacterium wieringae]UYO63438.1 terminase small subunit [Acetobacterium wieringae]
MNERQKRFADEYIITGKVIQSALAAGYSVQYSKSDACKILERPDVKEYIDKQMEAITSEKTATAQEVLEYLTKAIRFELNEEVVVVVDGSPQIITKRISLRDSNKCAELLAKRHRLLIDKVEADINRTVVFEGENELED